MSKWEYLVEELISYQAIPLVGSWSKEVKGYAYLGMLKRALS
jgi:hypothetical protein